uniref:Uncharacterized protein n=1 Tax=Amphimedon queenslandica TaxID=400682 RepID=A0A1X7SIK2_AMPQE
MGQNITKIATFQPTLSNGRNISVSTGFEFVSNKEIKITGKPGEEDDLSLRLIGFENIKVSVRIKLIPCQPGYVIDDDTSSCVCSASNNDKSLTYDGIYRCDESKEVALALKGYWAGYVLPNKSATPNPNNLYTSDCPLGFCRSYNKSHYSLTGNASKDELEKVLLQTVVESVNIGTDFKSFEVTRSVYTVLYSTLNLDFFDIDKLSFCLWNGASTLDMISIQY